MKTKKNKKQSKRLLNLLVMLLAVSFTFSASAIVTDYTKMPDSASIYAYTSGNNLNESDALVYTSNSTVVKTSTLAEYSVLTEGEVMEETMELEEWMMDAGHTFWSTYLKVDKEEEIELEDWMMDISLW